MDFNAPQQQQLTRYINAEAALQAKVGTGEYDANEPGVKEALQRLTQLKQPLMQAKQQQQAKQMQEALQQGMHMAAMQKAIQNVHLASAAKNLPGQVMTFNHLTDDGEYLQQQYYPQQSAKGDVTWHPVEYATHHARADRRQDHRLKQQEMLLDSMQPPATPGEGGSE
jgi:hypothetical protein